MTTAILALVLIAATPAATPPAPAKSTSGKATPAKPAPAKAPTTESQGYYDQARFDEAITLLRDLVERGTLSPDAQLRAREILARCYVKKGYPVLAKSHFKAILATNPSFRPDPLRVPPDEAAVFEQALREYREGLEPKGATAAAAGTAATRNASAGEPGKGSQLEQDIPATSTGTVRVSSGGIWAEVFLDGKTTGKTTPCILEGLSFGKHVISVARAGFVVESGPQAVTVRPGENAITKFRLRSETP